MENLFDEQCILEEYGKDFDEVIKSIENKLIELEVVRKEYIDEVLEREKAYPTGLVLKHTNIAIPHTFPENNVIKNRIILLKVNSIKFNRMDNPEEEISVSYIFLLALKEANHLEVLKRLFSLFQDEDKLIGILNKKDNKIICRELNDYINTK